VDGTYSCASLQQRRQKENKREGIKVAIPNDIKVFANEALRFALLPFPCYTAVSLTNRILGVMQEIESDTLNSREEGLTYKVPAFTDLPLRSDVVPTNAPKTPTFSLGTEPLVEAFLLRSSNPILPQRER
jgi:hypothetical protein